MATVNNNTNAPLDLRGIPHGELLFAGCNVVVSDECVQIIKTHPYLKTLLETGALSIPNKAAAPEGEKFGFDVVEDKRSGEDYPIIDKATRESVGKKKPAPTKLNTVSE